MGALSTLTTGVAGAIRTYLRTGTGAGHVQIMRAQKDSGGNTPTSWSATTTGSASVLAADEQRTSLTIVSRATDEVLVRFDGTIPTYALHSWYLMPGDRWEVPVEKVGGAFSFAARTTNGGYLLLTPGTDV